MNYHKLGREYLVSIRIEPVINTLGDLVAFVAVGRELRYRAAQGERLRKEN
jgi:hypothetical protein